LVKRYDQEINTIIEELVNFCYFMRGGLQLHEAYYTTVEERKLMSKMIEGHMKMTKDSGVNFL
jgi:predicted metallopeptidase